MNECVLRQASATPMCTWTRFWRASPRQRRSIIRDIIWMPCEALFLATSNWALYLRIQCRDNDLFLHSDSWWLLVLILRSGLDAETVAQRFWVSSVMYRATLLRVGGKWFIVLGNCPCICYAACCHLSLKASICFQRSPAWDYFSRCFLLQVSSHVVDLLSVGQCKMIKKCIYQSHSHSSQCCFWASRLWSCKSLDYASRGLFQKGIRMSATCLWLKLRMRCWMLASKWVHLHFRLESFSANKKALINTQAMMQFCNVMPVPMIQLIPIHVLAWVAQGIWCESSCWIQLMQHGLTTVVACVIICVQTCGTSMCEKLRSRSTTTRFIGQVAAWLESSTPGAFWEDRIADAAFWWASSRVWRYWVCLQMPWPDWCPWTISACARTARK